jgi:FkbM family methyltransferase
VRRMLILLLLGNSLLAEAIEYVSQYGQDKYFVEELFKDKRDGFFIDVGAGDGHTLSNTEVLEKLGWNGICIEPRIPAFKRLKENRSCICLNCCVGPVRARLPFLHVIGGCELLSGLYDYLDARHKERILLETALNRGSLEMVMVDCYPLNQILDAYGITHIDLLKLDTEGSEIAILNSIDFKRYTVNVICIEDNYGLEADISRMLAVHGFVLTKHMGCDLIYVNKALKASV